MTQQLQDIPNPKRDTSSASGRAGWYPYYAGFSFLFAESVLQRLGRSPEPVVLDPWNGSGTTTAACAAGGIHGVGYDLNPAMVVVARARLLNKRVRACLGPLAAAFTEVTVPCEVGNEDPLLLWMDIGTVRTVRTIEFRIQQLLMGHRQRKRMVDLLNSGDLADLVAFYYVALFRLVRRMLQSFQSSNPTWLRSPGTNHPRVKVPRAEIRESFRHEVDVMVRAFASDQNNKDGPTEIGIGSSDAVPWPDGSIDFVLASPPYCTRIDYAAATRPELAVLGMDPTTGFQSLRRQLIGTTTVHKETPMVAHQWGRTCHAFLEQVTSHPSKASRSYYFKGYCQYFDSVFRSLSELRRCLRTGAPACLVVQDSYYKEVHNDLPSIYVEMSRELGLELEGRMDFRHGRSMAQVNTRARQYREVGTPIESVLWFCKS